MKSPRAKPHRPRRSACADASLQAEIERLSRMTVEGRIMEALSMGDRFAWVQQLVGGPTSPTKEQSVDRQAGYERR